MLRHYMKDTGLVMGRVVRTRENPKDLGKPRIDGNSDTLSILPQEPLKRARRNTRGALGLTVYRRTASGEGASAWKP
ncbi:hypothetical protein TNCV_3768831 [Trichonephila clavipes]|nr:hypothetical protein TNCV_3768831 [Trichonephila clavipes]